MAEIQSQIEEDRRRLEGQKDMAEEEKRKVEENLMQKETELAQAQLVLNTCLLRSYVVWSIDFSGDSDGFVNFFNFIIGRQVTAYDTTQCNKFLFIML